ncbi:MAG: hypothetical protein HYW24_00620 [Candidatus Aenigmarchaeota archaeon]|nr:hypothetical protein [Candidatus Aenigmarchaeota archaeon]
MKFSRRQFLRLTTLGTFGAIACSQQSGVKYVTTNERVEGSDYIFKGFLAEYEGEIKGNEPLMRQWKAIKIMGILFILKMTKYLGKCFQLLLVPFYLRT